MGTGHAGKGMGNEGSSGHQHTGTNDPRVPDEGDVAQQRMGNNQLQGNDQRKARNERGTMPDETTRTEGVKESFDRMDPRKRS